MSMPMSSPGLSRGSKLQGHAIKVNTKPPSRRTPEIDLARVRDRDYRDILRYRNNPLPAMCSSTCPSPALGTDEGNTPIRLLSTKLARCSSRPRPIPLHSARNAGSFASSGGIVHRHLKGASTALVSSWPSTYFCFSTYRVLRLSRRTLVRPHANFAPPLRQSPKSTFVHPCIRQLVVASWRPTSPPLSSLLVAYGLTQAASPARWCWYGLRIVPFSSRHRP